MPHEKPLILRFGYHSEPAAFGPRATVGLSGVTPEVGHGTLAWLKAASTEEMRRWLSFPVSLLSTQFSVAGIGPFPFSGTPRKWFKSEHSETRFFFFYFETVLIALIRTYDTWYTHTHTQIQQDTQAATSTSTGHTPTTNFRGRWPSWPGQRRVR